MSTRDATRDQRRRHTFWIDDRVIDAFAPVMSRYPFGAAALAVYATLARRADRDGASWPRLSAIAEQAATSERTAQRAIQLLEVLGLVEVTSCFEEGSKRQTSNLYTLLTPPAAPPELDPNPARWPTPSRRTRMVRAGQRTHTVADARQEQPVPLPVRQGTPRQADTPPPANLTPRPRHGGAPSPVRLTPQEGLPSTKDNTLKDRSFPEDDTPRSFMVAEVGLSSGQVWAATLAELTRGGGVSATDLEAWLRPAALIGREGEALVIGTPNSAARDRIASRLLPEVRSALARVLGVALPVTVVVSHQAELDGRLDWHTPGPEAAGAASAPEHWASGSWR
jgi:hypothetical protein